MQNNRAHRIHGTNGGGVAVDGVAVVGVAVPGGGEHYPGHTSQLVQPAPRSTSCITARCLAAADLWGGQGERDRGEDTQTRCG